jgi:hypothetical protein
LIRSGRIDGRRLAKRSMSGRGWTVASKAGSRIMLESEPDRRVDATRTGRASFGGRFRLFGISNRDQPRTRRRRNHAPRQGRKGLYESPRCFRARRDGGDEATRALRREKDPRRHRRSDTFVVAGHRRAALYHRRPRARRLSALGVLRLLPRRALEWRDQQRRAVMRLQLRHSAGRSAAYSAGRGLSSRERRFAGVGTWRHGAWPEISIRRTRKDERHALHRLLPAAGGADGRSDGGLGAGRTRALLPFWGQKDFGDWSTFGAAAIGSIPVPAPKTTGSLAGSCNASSPSNWRSASSCSTRRRARSPAFNRQDSTSARSMISASISICSPRQARAFSTRGRPTPSPGMSACKSPASNSFYFLQPPSMCRGSGASQSLAGRLS